MGVPSPKNQNQPIQPIQPTTASYPMWLLDHFRASGITEGTLRTCRIREATTQEMPKINQPIQPEIKGICFPYFGPDRKPSTLTNTNNQFYRVRLDPAPSKAKYVQPANAGNHLYLPLNASHHLWFDPSTPIIITEGEKKAIKACQEGFLTAAVGGVDSWRSRTFTIKGTKLIPGRKNHTLKIDAETQQLLQELEEQVAQELVLLANANAFQHRIVYIIYDTDPKPNPNVDRAAFELALWLESHGAIVRRVYLPSIAPKTGLDDFLAQSQRHQSEINQQLQKLLNPNTTRFPTHPNIKKWVINQLNNQHGRQTVQRVARGVLADLDFRGRRFADDAGGHYFFDRQSKILYDFIWGNQEMKDLRLSPFGIYLQQNYDLGTTDQSTLSRLADQFTATEPIQRVTPRGICATKSAYSQVTKSNIDAFYYQIDDSTIIRITAARIDIVENGTDGMLFRSGQVVPFDQQKLKQHLTHSPTNQSNIGDDWLEALSTVSLEPLSEHLTIEETRLLLLILYHLSPWLRRWRGLMLPFELYVAEPSSGKTYLQNLRKGILTGNSQLGHSPDEIRSWYSTMSKAPAIWICDNLGDLPKDVRDRISDEIARLITDPIPAIETRKLYTTATSQKFPVDATFAATTITNPFHKPDILQRSLIFHLKAVPEGQRDAQWYHRRLQHRERWAANHLIAIQRFFQQVEEKWNPEYLSSHRLAHFEQSLLLMGAALGYPAEAQNIVNKLTRSVQAAIAEGDPIMEALKTFALEHQHLAFPPQDQTKKTELKTSDIVDWVQTDMQGRFIRLRTLSNTITLGRYLNSHAYDVERSAFLRLKKRQNSLSIEVLPASGTHTNGNHPNPNPPTTKTKTLERGDSMHELADSTKSPN
jgi:hypothetical protein